MAAKMDVLIVPSTGHVLAAAVRGDTGGPAPDAASLVGNGLLIRQQEPTAVELMLAPQHLEVRSIDLRDDVLLSPRRFVLADNLPELGDAPDATPVALSGTEIEVNIVDAAPEGGTIVWVYIEGGPQPIVHRVEIPETEDTATEGLLLAPGTYRVLVLAPGYEAVMDELSVP